MSQLIEQGQVKQTLTLEQERDTKLELLSGYYNAALQLANKVEKTLLRLKVPINKLESISCQNIMISNSQR